MLERASLCLESGGRHLLRGPKSHLRSRRTLHSSFWHHGAGDLDLPAWWASVLQPSPASDSQPHDPPEESGRNAARQAAAQDGLFLDFLYPAKTLALMHHLSGSGWEGWQARQARVATAGRARHYSSNTKGPGNNPNASAPPPDEDLATDPETPSSDAGLEDPGVDNVPAESDEDLATDPETPGSDAGLKDSDTSLEDSDVDDVPAEFDDDSDPSHDDPFKDMSPMPMPHTTEFESARFLEDLDPDKEWVHQVENPAEELRSLLEAGESDSTVIWKLWKRSRKATRTPELSAAALEYFSSVRPFVRTLAEEVVSIFKALDIEDRRTSSYRGAVVAYLSMGKLGRAALVHQECIDSGKAMSGNIATSDILAHAIEKQNWQLAIEAYTAMSSVVGPQAEFWSVAEKSFKLSFLTESFLVHFRRMRLLTGREPEEQDQIRAFASEFGARAIEQFAPNARNAASGLNLYRLIMRLKRDCFLETRHFEHALEGMLGSKKTKHIGKLPKVVRKLFHMYIATAKADPTITVNAQVLYTVLYAITRTMNISHGTRERGPRLDIGHVIEAVTHFFKRPPNAMLELLMDSFAGIGDVKQAKNYFRQIPVPQRKPWHYEYLLKGYAKRGDIVNATEMFEKISSLIGKTPHVRAWNVLLHAYVRNDDLVGASRIFDDLMASSERPDTYSFTAMLDLMSQRGDVDGVKDMFALAADFDPNMIQTTELAGYLVTAFINIDDMEAAELVAEQLRKRKGSGRMEGSFRPIWNLLATAYALRRDVAATRRIYEEMQKDGTTPDEMTYAALLQALCLTGNTDGAYKVLRLVIPKKLRKPLALHYAIVMGGYINQGSYEKVPYVDMLRKQRGILPSTSTRVAVAKAVALSEHVGRYRKERGEALTRTDQVVSDMILKESPWEWVMEPQTGLGLRNLQETAGAYLDLVMLIQGDRKAFNTVDQLYKAWQQLHKPRADPNTETTGMTPPLRMLVALMNTQFKAEAYDEVERLWNLAVDKAAMMTEQALPKAAVNPESPQPTNALPPARRHLLSRPLVIYLRTLHYQGRYADAQRIVSELLAQGYTLDNLAWNLYIQLLARTGRISLAFSLCEQHLMPQWVGWRSSAWHSSSGAKRRHYFRTRGWDYMNINPNLTKRNVVMPQYRTMVFLAAALKYVRRLRAVGGGGALGNIDGDVALSETLLRTTSPRTMAALQAMPRLQDDLQRRFLMEE
ncbi:hypothetical protein SLS58_010058 [Diplodia intermedia]|uniref:Pentatricopeptide repeat-containing protein n=1 Tax=Diplodia intermedia TaxID=856260 RepID=A0ABR3T8K8_9PEZI